MASQLKVDTITGVTTAGSIAVTGEGNSTTTNLQQGLAKFYISNASDQTSILKSFNVSSLDDDGTGEGGVNLSNNFDGANYAVTTGVLYNGSAGASDILVSIESQSSSAVEVESSFNNATTNMTFFDRTRFLTGHGDLA